MSHKLWTVTSGLGYVSQGECQVGVEIGCSPRGNTSAPELPPSCEYRSLPPPPRNLTTYLCRRTHKLGPSPQGKFTKYLRLQQFPTSLPTHPNNGHNPHPLPSLTEQVSPSKLSVSYYFPSCLVREQTLEGDLQVEVGPKSKLSTRGSVTKEAE